MADDKIEKLDYYALKTLESLPQWQYPGLEIAKTSRNVFVGSGDADNTGRIFAQNFGGHGFSVVDYKSFFENNPETDLNVYIVNASGAKDGIKMAEWLTNKGWHPKLVTSNPEPPAGKFLRPEFCAPARSDQAAIWAISPLAAAMAFSRCSAPSATPSARMKVTSSMPKKPNTPRR